ncbi:hypothetical protein [Neobacillus drentensis]|uniref:hypothetical protein n=1 Tax=Neobacillus drentensis TaxID=220684 RepID=UPI002865B20C|nr:hypothetical protein [Neobacillus drentensis]MDR7240497.1 hypothetical protein [Neobacillus drentensis]
MSNYNGLFSFVGNFSSGLLELIFQLEEALFTQPQTVLMQARLYTEQLVKTISKEEGIENVYPLKHAERIYKLYRQNAIEENIYMKLEWIRKKGNKAAHDVSSVYFEDGYKAHKYLFEISVWYMQVYVSYDFEAPIYKLPNPKKEGNQVPKEDLDTLIKPFLDQSLKQMDELRKELQRELEEIKKAKEPVPELVETPKEKTETVQFSLLKFMKEQGITYIDKRSKNGALWILGGWELNEKLFPLKEQRIYFRFMKKGSRATDYQPAWFLLNKQLKDPEVEENHLISSNQPVEKKLEEENLVKKNPVSSIYLKEVTSDFWHKKGQLLIPQALLNQEVGKSTLNGIKKLAQYVSVQTFGDLSEEHLRSIYKSSQEDFHYVIQDLFWFGCRFDGRLAAFQPLPNGTPEHCLVVKGKGEEEIRLLLLAPIAKRFLDKGIHQLLDLQGSLSQSIRWLIKVDAQIVVEQLANALGKSVMIQKAEPKHSVQPIQESKPVERMEVETNAADSQESPLPLTFQGETMEIRNDLVQLTLDELGIHGCDNMIRQLMDQKLTTLRDFPAILDELHMRLRGVGAGTVKKFWMQLGELNGRELPQVKPEYDENGNKLVYLQNQIVTITTTFFDQPLLADDFPFAEKSINNIIASGIKTWGDLPYQFEEIGKAEGVGKKKVETIFYRFQALLEIAKKQLEFEQMSPAERLNYELAEFENWFTQLMEDKEFLSAEKVSARYLEITHRRYSTMLAEGKHLTLEMLGEQEGVTRERVRQIIAKGDTRVVNRLNGLITLLKQQLKESNHFMILPLTLDPSLFTHFVLKTALEYADFILEPMENEILLSDLDKDKLEEYQANIKADIEKAFYLHVITPTDFQGYCMEKGEEDGVDPKVIEIMSYSHIKWLSAEQGVLKGMRKFHAVEMVMLQYPDGVEVYKKEDELNEKANDIMPGEFTGVRDFQAIATRNDLSDRIFLWGRGVYIHASFVTTDAEWVRHVESIAEKWLETLEFIHVRKLYEEVRKEAEQGKVPNEYALFTLLRRYSTGKIAMTKFPFVQPEGAEKQMNADYIEQFIREKGGYVEFKDLMELFVEKRGWKRFTLEFTLSTNERFLQYKHGNYTLLSHYDHIQLKDLPFVVSAIQEKLSESPFMSIASVFADYEVILKSLGIETKQILYAILKNKDGIEATFPHFPYVVALNHKLDSISGVRYIEQFILDQEDIVAREEVVEWVENLFGEGDRILDIALSQVPEILYYAKGQYGEYIHRQVLGLDEQKENQLHETIKARLQEVISAKGREYAMVSELFNPSLFPELAGGIQWTSDLLEDVLKKSGKWTIIGSYGEIILSGDSKISDEVAFLEYVLSHHFKGAAKLHEFLRFLTNIRYSSGKLLFAAEEAMRKGEARYILDGDEIILKSLMKGVK